MLKQSVQTVSNSRLERIPTSGSAIRGPNTSFSSYLVFKERTQIGETGSKLGPPSRQRLSKDFFEIDAGPSFEQADQSDLPKNQAKTTSKPQDFLYGCKLSRQNAK